LRALADAVDAIEGEKLGHSGSGILVGCDIDELPRPL
jgi:hypothetical protein